MSLSLSECTSNLGRYKHKGPIKIAHFNTTGCSIYFGHKLRFTAFQSSIATVTKNNRKQLKEK